MFFLTAAGCFSSVLNGYIALWFNAAANPHIYGKIIFFGSLFGYAGSLPAFWKAGKSYERFIEKQKAKREKAAAQLA